jgi:FkbM family methyltransferase
VKRDSLAEHLLTHLYRNRRWLRRYGLELGRTSLGMHLWMLLKELNVNVVIDVGARHGEYGLWLRRNGYDGWIFSFEPVKESYAALTERSASDGRWIPMPYALGREAGQAEINVAEGTVFSSFLNPNDYAVETFGSSPSVAAAETVQVKTLDEVLDGLLARVSDPRPYLKLDTQGWDLEVLGGARSPSSGCSRFRPRSPRSRCMTVCPA